MATTPHHPSAILQDVVNLIQGGLLNAALTAQGFTGAGAAPTALSDGTEIVVQAAPTNLLGFFGEAPAAQPTITGTAPTDPIVVQLLAALVSLGLVVDGTT